MSRAEQHRALAAEALHRLQLTPLADDSATDEESPINNKSKTSIAMNPISATATTTTAATTDTTKLKDGEEDDASRSLQFRYDEEDEEASSSSSPRPNHPTDGFAAAERPKVTVFRPSPPTTATTVQNVPKETAASGNSSSRSNPTTSHGVPATQSLTKRSEAAVAVGTAEVPQLTTRAAGSHHHSSSEALPLPPPAAAAVVAPPLRVVGKSPQVPRSITVVSSSSSGTTTKSNTVPVLKSHSPVAISTSSQQRDASLSSTMAPAPILAHRSPSPDLDANAVHPAAVYKSTPQAAVPIEAREELSPTATTTAEAGQGGTTGAGPTPPRSNATTGGRSLHPPPPSSSLKRSPSWGGSSSTVGARSSPNAIERTLRLRLETAENRAASLETQVASLEETVRLLHKQAALQPTATTTTTTATSSVRSEDHHLTTHKDNNNHHNQHQQQELRLANLQKILQDEIKSKRSLERSMEDLGVVLQRHVRELQLVSEERDQLAARNSVLVLEVEAARRELREVRQELGGATGLARKGSSTLGRNPSASPLRKKTSSMGSLLSGGAAAERSRNRTPTPTQQPAATSRISRQSSVASVCRTPSPVVRSSAAAAAAPTTTTTATHHSHPASPRQVTFQANHQVVRSRQPTPERRPRSPVAAAPPARGLSPKPVTGAAVRAVPSATLPPPPTSTSSRPSAGAAAPPPPSSAKRTVSPILARQQLAAASFLKATNASAIRSGGAAAAARPKLTSGTEPATEKRKTALVMRDGKAFNMSEVPPSQRRRTPVSERIEAAVAKIAALEAERQQQQHR